MNDYEFIVNAFDLNVEYADRLIDSGLPRSIVGLYQDIARRSYECARAWDNEEPCPPHPPTVDAFVQAAWEWAQNLGYSFLEPRDMNEWYWGYVQPGIAFSDYVSPRQIDAQDIRIPIGPAANIFLKLDKVFTRRVIRLTFKRGPLYCLRLIPKLPGAFRTLRMMNPGSRVGRYILDLDIWHTESTLASVDWGSQSRIPGLASEFITKAKEANHV